MPALDPFRATPDVDAYVPRPATEAALAALEQALRRGDSPALLRGPAGIGKTLVAHAVAARLRREHAVVHVPVPSLAPRDLWAWIAGALGVDASAPGDARAAALARASADRPLLVVVDDAELLPAASLASLVDALGEGALRLLLVAGDDERGDALVAALGVGGREVWLREPMTRDETAAYVAARVAAARGALAGDVLARFDDAALARVHALSEGVPARVHELADVLLQPEEAARAHEHARALRPDAVARGIAQRSGELVERLVDLPDEDLALAVARRRSAARSADARDAARDAALDAARDAALDAARDSARDAARESGRDAGRAGVSPATDARPASAARATSVARAVPAARAPSAERAAGRRVRAARADRQAAGAAAPRRAGDALPYLLGALAVALALAAAFLWATDRRRAASAPAHTARFVDLDAAPSPPPEPAAPARAAALREAAGAAPEPAAADGASAQARAASDAAARDRGDAAALAVEPPAGTEAAREVEPPAGTGAAREVELPAGTGAALAVEPPAEAAPAPAPSSASTAAIPAARPRAAEPAARAPERSATGAQADVESEVIPPALRAVAGRRPPAEIAIERGAPVLVRIVAREGDEVRIDGALFGRAPIAEVALAPGEHRFSARSPSGEEREVVARVDDAHRRVDLASAGDR